MADILEISGIKTAHKLNDAGSWLDMTASNDDLTAIGTVVNTVGHGGSAGTAALFAASSLTSSQSLLTSPSNIAQYGNTLFLMAWVNLPSLTSQNIISKWGGGQSSYRLYFDGTDFIFELSANGSTNFVSLHSRDVIEVDTWYPVICTYNQIQAKIHIGQFSTTVQASSALFSSTAVYTVGGGTAKIDDIAAGTDVPTEYELARIVLAADDHQFPKLTKTDEKFVNESGILSSTNSVLNQIKPKKLGKIIDVGSAGKPDKKRAILPYFRRIDDQKYILTYAGLYDDSLIIRDHVICLAYSTDIESGWTKPNLNTDSVFGMNRNTSLLWRGDSGANNVISSHPDINRTNLVGQWYLDEGSGNRLDISGSGYNLAPGGTPLPVNAKGHHASNQSALNRNASCDFSGGTNYLTIANTNTNAPLLNNTGAFSVSFWFYNSGATTNRLLVSKDDNSTQRSWRVFISSSNQIIAQVFGASTSPSITSAYPLGAGWYFVCFRYDQTNNLLRLRYNYTDATPVSFTDGAILSTTSDFTIGIVDDKTSFPHDSKVNDMLFYTSCITDSEVDDISYRADNFTPPLQRTNHAIIQDGSKEYLFVNAGDQSPPVIGSGCISHGGCHVNSVGADDILNINDKTLTQLYFGPDMGLGGSFNDLFITGVIKDPRDLYRPWKIYNQYAIYAPGYRRFAVLSSKTISGTYEMDNRDQGGFTAAAGSMSLARVYDPNILNEIHGVQAYYDTNAQVIDGQTQRWINAGGYDGFVDIVPMFSDNGYGFERTGGYDYSLVELGRWGIDEDGGSVFSSIGNIHIDDTTNQGTYVIYSASANPQQTSTLDIQTTIHLVKWGLNRQTSRCHSLWRGNICLWPLSDLSDKSGNIVPKSGGGSWNNNLTESLSPPTAAAGHSGTPNTAKQFTRASSQYLKLPFADAVGFPIVDRFTCTGFIELDSTGLWQTVIQQDVLNDYNFVIQVDTLNKLRFSMTHDGDWTTATLVTSTTVFTTSVSYHFACVADGTNLKMYINGVNESNTAFTRNPADPYLIWGSHADIYIGSSGGVSNFLDGKLDDLGLWARALTGAEITTLSNPTGTDDFNLATDSDLPTRVIAGNVPGLTINGQGNLGQITAAVIDPSTGLPFAGFDHSDFVTFTGDELAHVGIWTGGSDLTRLGHIIIEFELTRNAQIYGYQAQGVTSVAMASYYYSRRRR